MQKHEVVILDQVDQFQFDFFSLIKHCDQVLIHLEEINKKLLADRSSDIESVFLIHVYIAKLYLLKYHLHKCSYPNIDYGYLLTHSYSTLMKCFPNLSHQNNKEEVINILRCSQDLAYFDRFYSLLFTILDGQIQEFIQYENLSMAENKIEEFLSYLQLIKENDRNRFQNIVIMRSIQCLEKLLTITTGFLGQEKIYLDIITHIKTLIKNCPVNESIEYSLHLRINLAIYYLKMSTFYTEVDCGGLAKQYAFLANYFFKKYYPSFAGFNKDSRYEELFTYATEQLKNDQMGLRSIYEQLDVSQLQQILEIRIEEKKQLEEEVRQLREQPSPWPSPASGRGYY